MVQYPAFHNPYRIHQIRELAEWGMDLQILQIVADFLALQDFLGQGQTNVSDHSGRILGAPLHP